MGSARPEHHLPERGLGARWSARPRAAEWPEPSAERMSGGTSAVSSCGTVTPPVRSFVRAIPPTAGPGDDRTREATYARHRPRRSSRRWTCGGGDRRRAERGRFGEHDRSAPARDGVPDYEPDPSRACRPPADAREDLPRRRAGRRRHHRHASRRLRPAGFTRAVLTRPRSVARSSRRSSTTGTGTSRPAITS
jgi:hypothetical protein